MSSSALAATIAALLTAGVMAAVLPFALGQAVVGLTAAAVLAFKPRWLILIWALLGMFGNVRVGSQSIFGALTYASLPALLIVLAWRLPAAARRHPWIMVWLAFVLLVAVNTLRSPLGVAEALRNANGYLVTLAIPVLIVTEIDSVRAANRLLAVVLLASCVVAGYACYQFFAEVGGYAEGGGVYRTFSVYAWSNTLGFFLIMPAGLAAFALANARGVVARLCSAAAFIIIGGGLFFTFGRAAWISAAIAVAGPLLFATSPWRSVLVLPATAVLALVAIDFMGIDLTNRLTDPTNYIGREIVRDIGLRLSMESPLYGHGFLSSSELFDSTYDDLLSRGFHNMYVLTLYEFGFIGLVIFLLTWVVFAVECVRRFPKAGPHERQVLVTALSILAGVLLASWAGNDLSNFAPSIYLWITLAWASASRVYSAVPNDVPTGAEARSGIRPHRGELPRRSPLAVQSS